MILLREKTTEIIQSSVCNIKTDSNFFSTIAGSRTLAMLASFEEGRVVIKSIIARRVPINIFSYARTGSQEIPDEGPDKNMLDEMAYRSSPAKNFSKCVPNTKIIASKENVLTVLIDELSHDLYTLLFNCILTDSKKLGPGCLSSLTDALLYLQVRGNYSKFSLLKKRGRRYRIL